MDKAELIERAKELPQPSTYKRPPHWEFWQVELHDYLAKGFDPDKFYRFPCVYHTMLVNHWKYVVDQEIQDLPLSYRQYARMPNISSEDWIGDTEYSYNLMHQVYHLYQWEECTGKKINRLTKIVEVGAGYGAMALVVSRMGFKGDYYICDLPEFSLLQEYLLSNSGVDSDVNYYWNKEPVDTDLLIACYSLSEMTMEARQKMLDENKAKGYLFLFSEKWVDYNNLDYFKLYASHWAKSHFCFHPSKYLPEGNWYALGNIE